jgi:tRNA pseudouridine38-40 synthase
MQADDPSTHDSPYRYALTVEYDGSAFHGWQLQSGQVTVQGALEGALARIADAPVRVTAAGRTDARVHATAQVVDFRVPSPRPVDAWLRGTNSLLPGALAVRDACDAPAGFSARYSATARRYQYVILESPTRPAVLRSQVTWSRWPLDDVRMHAAAQRLVGEHDFTSYRAASCQSRTPFRCVHQIAVRRFGALVVIDITANAFLHHMVRNVASALLDVGRCARPPSWPGDVLLARARDRLGGTAPPDGLYLVEVRYGDAEGPGSFRPPPLLGALGDIW